MAGTSFLEPTLVFLVSTSWWPLARAQPFQDEETKDQLAPEAPEGQRRGEPVRENKIGSRLVRDKDSCKILDLNSAVRVLLTNQRMVRKKKPEEKKKGNGTAKPNIKYHFPSFLLRFLPFSYNSLRSGSEAGANSDPGSSGARLGLILSSFWSLQGSLLLSLSASAGLKPTLQRQGRRLPRCRDPERRLESQRSHGSLTCKGTMKRKDN